MAKLSKVRVQLLDEESGAVLQEVDVLTSADSVTFEDGETFQQKLDLGKLKGEKGDRGIQGEKGDKGETGANGQDGASAGFGTVTATVDNNSGTPSVVVDSSGNNTAKNFTFKFSNLKGQKGDTGDVGQKGDKGDPFTVKKTYVSIVEMNADFSNSEVKEGDFVMITSNVEDEDNAKLYVKGASAFTFVTDLSGAQGMKGDKGDTGEKGEKGENGTPATVAIGSTTTGEEGTDASVTNSGNSQNAIFNFTIPRGQKGDKGDNGKDGDNIRIGTEYESAQQGKLFFKILE